MKEITRRSFLFLTVTFPAIRIAGCSPKENPQQIAEVTVPVDGKVVTIDNVQNKVDHDVGITKILLFSEKDSPLVFVFAQSANNAILIPSSDRQRAALSLKSGFVSFNKSFNLKDSLKQLDDQERSQPHIIITPDQFKHEVEKFKPYVQAPGMALLYHRPPLDQAVMYVVGPNTTFIVGPNGRHLAEGSVLRLKFKFAKK